mmetsp:Transcript_11616/g.25394  ORF Transcript_11616/g.25394 Transcript_11616/m.25394 type:complete len:112 (-) Transcript_11616:663-998(-)|eukprot:CAMPEP_0116933456 /NCGR_PEP_ID=MMETSP0467-20121206/29054_1 /TAXON_ID=283647 /ORGANISM="Mesodinium pulex, Strain SPMC105" /LENGTH=111 /DNA_ID=CAMNT_0004614353 /DNA_START=237 /DNA_END=572 /DNA_ORIENTATION=-
MAPRQSESALEIKEVYRNNDKKEVEVNSLKTQNDTQHETIVELQSNLNAQKLEIKTLDDKLRAATLQLSTSETVADEKSLRIQKLTLDLEKVEARLASAEDKNIILTSKVK